MNKYVKRSLQIGIPLALAAWIIIPRIGGDGVQSKQNTPGNMGKGRLPVTGIIAKNSVVAAGFPVNGSLLANEEVDLVAEIVGKVRKIYFQEGVAVKKGQLLLKVDDADLQAQLTRAEFQKKLLAEKLERQACMPGFHTAFGCQFVHGLFKGTESENQPYRNPGSVRRGNGVPVCQ